MKQLILRLLALSVLAAIPLHAMVVADIAYGDWFTQTSAGVQSTNTPFVSFFVAYFPVDGLPTDSADSVFVTRPDGTLITGLPGFSGDWGWIGFWEDTYPLLSDVLFGDYLFNFLGGARAGTSEVLSLDPKLMPPPIPALTKSSFALLSSEEVSKPIRLVFRPWMLQGLGTMDEFNSGSFDKDILGWIGVSITEPSGEIAFAIRAADPRTATIVIPANSLKAGTPYLFSLQYHTQADSSKVSFTRELRFAFTSNAAIPKTSSD